MRNNGSCRRVGGMRRGLTLIELLVTMGIAVMLLAIALPVVKMTLDTSRVREASRQVNTIISGAKVRAATTGRPAGLWLERDLTNYNSCSRVYFAEVTQFYAGDSIEGSRLATKPSTFDLSPYLGSGAQAKFQLIHPMPWAMGATDDRPAFGNNSSLALLTDPANDPDPVKRLNSRFQIRFNYQGPWYHGIRVNNTDFYLYAAGPSGSGAYDESYDLLVNRGATPPTVGMPYQIMRAPRRSDTSVMELPRGTAIDLSYSGTGGAGCEMRATSATEMKDSMGKLVGLYPVVIMIQPSGAVSRLHVNGNAFDITNAIHLHVGRVEKVIEHSSDTPAMDAPYQFASETDLRSLRTKYNLFDAENLWVSLGHRSGAITTVENSPLDATQALPGAITQARLGAMAHQTKGGL